MNCPCCTYATVDAYICCRHQVFAHHLVLIDFHASHSVSRGSPLATTALYTSLALEDAVGEQPTIAAELEALFYSLIAITTTKGVSWRKGKSAAEIAARKHYAMTMAWPKQLAACDAAVRPFLADLHALFFPSGVYRRTPCSQRAQQAIARKFQAICAKHLELLTVGDSSNASDDVAVWTL